MSISPSLPYRSSRPPAPPVAPGGRGRLLALIWAVVAVALLIAVVTPLGFARLASQGTDWAAEFAANKTRLVIASVQIIALITAGAFLLAAIVATRPKGSLLWLRHLIITGYALVAIQMYAAVRIIVLIHEKMLAIKIGDADDLFNPYQLYGRIGWNKIGLIALVVLAILVVLAHVLSMRRVTVLAFATNDRRLRVDVHDVAYNSNIDTSIALHVLIIMVIPLALQLPGCSGGEYPMPGGGGGGGGPIPVVVKVLKQKKQPKRRKYVFRPNSVISFHTPTIDDSKIVMEVDKETENQFKVTDAGTGGGQGFGSGGGKGGGWPGGKEGAPIHFVRLKYDGLKWDDGMDASERADANFLEELHNISKLKTAGMGEALTASQLRNVKKGVQPPFLFMTGEGGINMSEAETRVVRQYLDAGGLLFCDCGSPQWHSAFVAWCRHLYPDHPLLDISNDDPIFSWYYSFPNGAPPLWHHGGYRALGVKVDGRLTVFYFPGNMNDAWKIGHHGADNQACEQSFHLGINVVKYAFDHYWAINHPPAKH